MDWIDIKKKKPQLGEVCLIFEQGYGQAGNYYSSYYVAAYIKSPFDKRRRVFAEQVAARIQESSPWIYREVTHWMRLPEQPEKTTKKQFIKERRQNV